MPRARHIEVQVLGDTQGDIIHLGERECSVQRRFQKVVEMAPAPNLPEGLRDQLINAALRLAKSVRYTNLGTFEFLVDATGRPGAAAFAFIEVNARLQVEHTVTEQITGVDLVQTQLRLAAGETLSLMGLNDVAYKPKGYAIQARVNLETLAGDGSVRPGGGTITVYEAPNGPGVRTDGFAYAGYRTSNAFDSLLAKVIGHATSGRFGDAVQRTSRALREFRLHGVRTNISFLLNVLEHPDFAEGAVHTRWVDEKLAELVVERAAGRRHYVPVVADAAAAVSEKRLRFNSSDPLALFEHDARMRQEVPAAVTHPDDNLPFEGVAEGTLTCNATIQGTVAALLVAVGDSVQRGATLAVIEAMKMEHLVTADKSGVVMGVLVHKGDVVLEGQAMVLLEEAEVEGCTITRRDEVDLDHIRDDLREVFERHALTLDEARPDAVRKRHEMGYRMPRENIAELADPGSFKEYWPLIVARQHQRNDLEQLRSRTPADGVVAGTCSINGDQFSDDRSRAMIVHYDYTVLAGTQGHRNHYKQDRMFKLAQQYRLPVVLFGEGGGGRPGEDWIGPRVAFDSPTFTAYSKLSGLVPLIAVINGRTFAGNTALVAASDVIIATVGSTIGMGGPAMIEGGGLGIYQPEEVGPMSFQVPNGVVDILVKDEKEAVAAARKYLSYFQGPTAQWEAHDQRPLRHVIPENRLRLYDMRQVMERIVDKDSVLELREKFAVGIITAFARLEGKPVGIIANNPHHLAGAVDSDGADKASRFMRLCDAFDIPIMSLMDCPGIMVGPDHERTALVRHCVRLFNAGANLTTPLFAVALRKAYGLGVQAMCGGSALVGFGVVAWPTAEFAAMNIEGAVKLGYRKELAAIGDPQVRLRDFEQRVAEVYENAKAVNATMGGGVDDVIDPAETRAWIVASMRRLPPTPVRTGKKYPFMDPW